MITDDELHRLAIFLGSCAMMMIVLYHFLEVNAKDADEDTAATTKTPAGAATAGASGSAVGAKDR